MRCDAILLIVSIVLIRGAAACENFRRCFCAGSNNRRWLNSSKESGRVIVPSTNLLPSICNRVDSSVLNNDNSNKVSEKKKKIKNPRF